MKSIKKGVILLVIGILFIVFGAFLKISKTSTDIIYNTLMTIGLLIEIIAGYLIFKCLKSPKKENG